jgi:hypothetical protein
MTSTAASAGRLKVWHESLWSAREDVAQAISQDGMTLLTRTPLPRGTKVFLEFPQEADGLRVGVDATVTHSGQDRMGVRFNGLDAAGRAVVAAWVERLPAPPQDMLLPDALDLPVTPPPVTPAPLPDEASLVETVLTPEPPPPPPKVMAAPVPMALPLTPPPVARRPAYAQADTLPDLMLEDVPATPTLGMDATQDLPVVAQLPDVAQQQETPVQDMPPLVGAAAVPHEDDLFDNLLSDPQGAAPAAPLEPAVPVASEDSGNAAMPWETGASDVPPELLDTSALDALSAGLDEPAPTPAPSDLDLAPLTPAGGASTAAPPPRLLSMPPPSDPEAPGVGDLFEGLGDPLNAPAAGEVDLFAQAQPATPAPLQDDPLPLASQDSLSELLAEPVPPVQDSLPPMPPVESPQVPVTPPPVGAPASFEASLQDVKLDSVPGMTAVASMLPQVAVPAPPPAAFGRPVTAAGVYRPIQDGVTLGALEAPAPGASPAVGLDEIAPGSDVLPDLELDTTSGDAFFETNWTQEPEGTPPAPPAADVAASGSASLDHNAPVTRDPLFDAWGQAVMVPQLAEETSPPRPSFSDDPDAPAPGAPLLDAPALGDLPPVESLAFQGFGDQTAQVEIPAGVQAFAWAVQNAPPSQQGVPGTPRVPQDSPDFDPVFDLAPVDEPAPPPPPARPAMPAVLATPPPLAPAPAPPAPEPARDSPPPHAPPAFLDLGAPMRHPTPAPMRLRSSTPAATPVRPPVSTRAPAAPPAPVVPSAPAPAAFGAPRSSSGAPLLSMDAAHPPAPVAPGSSPRLPPIPAASSPQLPTLPQPVVPPTQPVAQQYDASFDAALEQGFPSVATPALGSAQGPGGRVSNSSLPTMGPVIPSSGAGTGSRPLPPPGAFGPPPALSVDAASIMPSTGAGTGSRPLPAVLTLGTPAGGLPTVPPTLPAAAAPPAPLFVAPEAQDPFAFERAVDTDHASRSALVGGGAGGFLGDDTSNPGVDLTGAGTTGLMGAPRQHTPSNEPPLSRPDPMVAQAALGDLDLSGSPADALPLASGAEMLMQHPENRFSNSGGERSRTEDALPAVGGILLDGQVPAASFGPPPGGPPAFGRPATGVPPGFGPPPGSPFGTPASSPGFGAPPSAPGFGAPPSAPGFGAPASAPAFGAPPSAPGFGAPSSAPHFGAPQSTPGFGGPPPVFAAPSSPPATFGRPVTGEPLMAAFGRPRTNVDPNASPLAPPAPQADEDLPLVVQGQLLPPAGAAPAGLPPAARWRPAMTPQAQQPAPPLGQVPPTQPAATTGPAAPNLSAEIDRLFDED